ncbi:NACHT and WD repeat domain-containing protein 2 isoform X1 [Lepisosteus oculatus]|uniref:NACHT and WD repeat domain-containing protein 2 isoform X1 n=1 Tax=Lepisosteus oculatus TaxID=7918 RepID=UPI00372019C2
MDNSTNRLLSMDFSKLSWKAPKACIKVFLCVNPEDFQEERKALRETIYPKIREYCRYTYGLEFRVIDAYEGLDPHGLCDSRAQQVRLELLEECKESSAGPFFVALIGEQYGRPCLPAQIEVSEFQEVLRVCQQAGVSTQPLERWYRRDENAIPPAFCLLDKQEVLCSHYCQTDEQARQTDQHEWQEAFQEMKMLFFVVVTRCIQEGTITPEQGQKYFISALEKEMRFALENCSKEDIERCLCYVHKISNLTRQRERVVEPQAGLVGDSELQAFCHSNASALLCQLRDVFLPNLVTSSGLQVYTSTTTCELRQGYTPELRQEYTEGLCEQVYANMLNLIDRTVSRNPARLDTLTENFLQQLDLCDIYSSLYRLECAEVENIKSYFVQKETKYPLVVSGGPCTGKTVLLAHCAKQVGLWLSDRNPVVVVYFIRGDSDSLKHLLSMICQQLAASYDQPLQSCLKHVSQLKEEFVSLLSAPSSERPLILILDGLDQIAESDRTQSIWWLPKFLPPHVKFLISTAPKKLGILQALKVLYRDSSQFVELRPMNRKDLSKMLTDLLLSSKRKITSGQQVYINKALNDCPLALYVELLYRQVRLWRSELEVTEDSLRKGVHDNIKVFLGHLEEKHGKELVIKAMCYITIARSGFTEAELTDILSSEDHVLSTFLPGDNLPFKLRLPESTVEKLLLDLKGVLVRRYVLGSQVLFWANRHFPIVINKLYLGSDEKVQEMHNTVSNYFSDRWAYGRAKPLILSHNQTAQGKPLFSLQASSSTPAPRIYIDRQQPSQPWLFNSPKTILSNLRKIHELPFHLRASGRLDELIKSIILTFGFQQAMLKAGHLNGMISEIEETSLLAFNKELKLLASILRRAACLLQVTPDDLTMVIQIKLLPFVDILPGLVNYAKQIYQEGLQNCGINVVHSSVMSVPSTRSMLSAVDVSPVAEVLETQSETIVMILENGSVWAWNEDFPGGFKCINSSDLGFTSAKCAGQFLLLSTKCNRLLLCNLNDPTVIQEIDFQKSISKSPATPHTVQGFLVVKSSIFVWFRGAKYVCIFDLNTGKWLGQLDCRHEVTCVSCSSNGKFAFCGQHKSTVSIFDTHNEGRHLSTSSTSVARASILHVLHSECEDTMSWVDSFGNVFVWDIETITQTRLLKECYNPEDREEVLGTENSVENKTFLICKQTHIVLWNTTNWTICDQFKAPRNKRFIQAVLSSICSLIIASLEDCPFLLVWNRNTGQCILSLDAGHTQVLKLVKQQSTLVAVTVSGCLTFWDLDLILGASCVSKTGITIKRILTGSQGEHIYTTDGTEVVYKWGMLSGSLEGSFCHRNPVEICSLTGTGKYLVTSDSSGDIYVWKTDTGENLYRIRGCHASQHLITPNSHLVVSICEHSLSRVWNLSDGHIVCNVHLYLENAAITPESTFVLGLHERDLLAVSLWSGCVSKRFSCGGETDVVAFQPLLEHPDYVVLINSSGFIYTWNIAKETIRQHVQVPVAFLSQLDIFQLSSDGRYAIISIDGATINVLDTLNGTLCSLEAKAQVLFVSLALTGNYIVFICDAEPCNCSCDFHSQPVLNVVQVSNGENVGSCYLCKSPSALAVSDNLSIFVGFKDGSLGIYALAHLSASKVLVKNRISRLGQGQPCLCEEPKRWLPMETPSIIWADSPTVP